MNDDWIAALFQLDRTNRIINGHNLGNTWETAETDEEERYQTLKRYILRSPVSIVMSYQTKKKKNCDVNRAKKKTICDVIRDVIAPCPVIG